MKDPVCGMEVKAPPEIRFKWKGIIYGFCHPGCLERFGKEPEKYLSAGKDLPDPSGKNLYLCPMHPEVIQKGPGSCPKCGMALEARDADPSETANAELSALNKRFRISLALSLPLFLISMGEMPPAFQDLFPHDFTRWMQALLATPVVLWCGGIFFRRAYDSLRHRSPNMFTLIATGTGAAYFFSILALLVPDFFPSSFGTVHGQIGLYFESAAMIITLVLLGQVLELKARGRTQSAVKALLSLQPKTARLVKANGEEIDVLLEKILAGDTLRVRPGGSVPVDGTLLEGTSLVDESMVTGESVPVEKGTGSKVTGGTINGTGSFLMRAERVGKETLLAKIVKMVNDAQRSRAPIQRLADKVSFYFVPSVFFISILTFTLWAFLGPEPKLAHAFINAIAVLIIACPCALGLATPMSIMVGAGRGAAAGILIKNAEALETLEKIDTLVIDKTGTLTEGKPRLMKVEALDSSEEEILRLAASLELASEHPLGEAITRAARSKDLQLDKVQNFRYEKGKGVSGTIGEKNILLGSQAMMKEKGVNLSPLLAKADECRLQGQSVLFLAVSGRASGSLSIADPVKASTPEALRLLRAEGIRIVMLTGDHLRTAQTVGKHLKIDEIRAEVLPADKGNAILSLQKEGRKVCMAGDGINDAPALAAADVGIAMGNGTDIAIESAGIVLVKGDLLGIAKARKLSRGVMKNIRQNLFLAFIYNALGVPIAAGALYPFFGLLLSPVLAAAAMSFSSVSVISNALRLRRTRL